MNSQKERELHESALLCDSKGLLNREAVGWSRHPLHKCNLSGRWPRKKKWNYWAVTTDRFMFSATIADVDYMGLAVVYLIDFDTMELYEKNVVVPFGIGFNMSPDVEKDVVFTNRQIDLKFIQRPEGIMIETAVSSLKGKRLEAQMEIAKPSGHETLNVVVPWSDNEFQFTSKQNAMPVAGKVTIGNKCYAFDPDKSFACLDYGRGIWPYKTKWNWASCSARKGADTIGLNLGGMWTDGTGSTENGICLNGKLYKISEDLKFSYDRNDFKSEWNISTFHTDTVDMTFKPIFEKISKANMILLKTEGHQMFGYFSGKVKTEAGTIVFDNFLGWAEEHIALW